MDTKSNQLENITQDRAKVIVKYKHWEFGNVGNI